MIFQEQDSSIAHVRDDSVLVLTFGRCVNEQLFSRWQDLLIIMRGVVLTNENDLHVWNLESSIFFSVKSF